MITNNHITKSGQRGIDRAIRQIESGHIVPDDDLWLNLDQNDFVFEVTGYKAPELEFGEIEELVDSYEQAYYDWWEEYGPDNT